MEQLLSIKSVPIKIEVNVKRYEYKPVENPKPSVKISKQNNGDVKIAAKPCKIDITPSQKFDSYEPSEVMNDGFKLTYEGVAKMMSSPSGEMNAAVQEIAGNSTDSEYVKASRNILNVLNSLPKTKGASSVSYNEGTLSIDYNMDNYEGFEPIDFSSGFEFIPGSIEFIISQMPDVEIEYVGDPLYFPRSANPNYEGIIDVSV